MENTVIFGKDKTVISIKACFVSLCLDVNHNFEVIQVFFFFLTIIVYSSKVFKALSNQ